MYINNASIATGLTDSLVELITLVKQRKSLVHKADWLRCAKQEYLSYGLIADDSSLPMNNYEKRLIDLMQRALQPLLAQYKSDKHITIYLLMPELSAERRDYFSESLFKFILTLCDVGDCQVSIQFKGMDTPFNLLCQQMYTDLKNNAENKVLLGAVDSFIDSEYSICADATK